MDFYVDDYINNENITLAITNAIIACNKAGGGNVIFSKNKTYISGAFSLLDNVCLYLEENSRLRMSDNLDDFDLFGKKDIAVVNRPTWENCDYNGKPTKYFIYGYGLKNISIKGSGIIDGNEEIFYGRVTKHHIEGFFYPRVPLIYLENCDDITLEGVTLTKSAFWTVHLVGDNNILVDNLNILNNIILANCDGIDLDHSKNAIIRNTKIYAADDCIVFKTTKENTKYGAVENILVENCVLTSTSAAVKIGTESVDDFKNIIVKDTKIVDSNRGISLQLRDKGNIYDCKFINMSIETKRVSDIEWWGKAEPIAITAVRRNFDTIVGNVSNILFENININSENGILLYSFNDNIKDITFNNVDISINKKTEYDINIHDLRPCEDMTIFNTDLAIVYSRGANNIKYNNLCHNVAKDIIYNGVVIDE